MSDSATLDTATAAKTSSKAAAAPQPAVPAEGGQKKKKKNRNKGQDHANVAAPAGAAPAATITSKSAPVDGGASTSADGDATIDARKDLLEKLAAAGDAGAAAGASGNMEMIRNWMDMLRMNKLSKSAKTADEAEQKSFKFWSTQPVPKLNEQILVNEPIEADKPMEELRQEPYSLPEGFHWDAVDIGQPLQLKELYTLLNENYVEDDDAMFRFDYQPEFLKWALQPPGWRLDWHVGVRVTKSNKLVGFISAIPGQVRVHNRILKIVEINFLCVHKKLRSKRVAPVLIREITRRVNLTGTFQAVYTAGVVLPKPMATCRYWHRSLNAKKLIEVNFSHLSRNMTMQRHVKLYKLPEATKTPGFRAIRPADMKKAHSLLETYLARFQVAPIFNMDEFRHWFTPQPDIMNAFVVENGQGQITDLVSFYTLPSTVMHHQVHKNIKAAYSFYNVASAATWTDLMNDALIAAKNADYDVFNALDLMDNKEFLQPLKFGIGDGNLQYYLYNWRCPLTSPEELGLILM